MNAKTNHTHPSQLNSMRITGIAFLIIIFLGSILLWLPVSNELAIDYFDALFTAVSAVCVTGLVTVVPAAQFTLFGKVVLLALIQIGGLGIVTLSVSMFVTLGIKISVKERAAMLQALGMGDLGGVVGLVGNIIEGSFLIEGIGAIGYGFAFVPEYGWAKGVGLAIFHSVSCFCNAGIDLLGESSLVGYVGNPLVNGTTILLIIVSGIGFSVWFDVLKVYRKKANRDRLYRGAFRELALHSKLAILTTLILIAGGTLAVFLLEYSNPLTLGSMTFGHKLLAALFQSVTDRTAGFYTIPQGDMRNATKLVNVLIMFVGGSPGGTAGGVKTTTMALLFMTLYSVIRGENEPEAFGRRVPRNLIRTALTIVLFFFSFLLLGTILIMTMEPETVNSMDILYETTSALCTVGLSTGITSTLCRGSQLVLMVLMYIGRLGPLTMTMMFVGKSRPRDQIRKWPQENIMIG